MGTFRKGQIMARKRHTPEQIIGKLRAIEVHINSGLPAEQAARKEGIVEQTYYRWRKEYGGLKADQLKRLKVLDKENQRLRRAVSDLTLDKMILTEASRGNF